MFKGIVRVDLFTFVQKYVTKIILLFNDNIVDTSHLIHTINFCYHALQQFNVTLLHPLCGDPIEPGAGCSTGDFYCPSSGICIPGFWVCDAFGDCDNNEDEQVCGKC